MKVVILVFTALFVAGCGAYIPLEELEHQAMLSGDWSEVEKRERMLLRRKMRHSIACPTGRIAICDKTLGRESCACVESDELRSILAGT